MSKLFLSSIMAICFGGICFTLRRPLFDFFSLYGQFYLHSEPYNLYLTPSRSPLFPYMKSNLL